MTLFTPSFRCAIRLSPSRLISVARCISAVSSIGVACTLHAAHQSADFNGDGRADLAIGVSSKKVGVNDAAGGVALIYGSNSGLNQAGDQFWTQASPGIQDEPDPYDAFGYALAWADFNNDGYADLAIGVPFEDSGGVNNAGAIHMLHGSPNGLISEVNEFWHRGVPGIEGEPEESANFGSALAAGDFNGDGFIDLAIGVPGQEVGGSPQAGEVHVLYGRDTGFSSDDDQVWSAYSPGIVGVPQASASMGATLAAGDYNGDGRDDLAIGAPYMSPPGSAPYSGGVHVLYGSDLGLTAEGNHLMFQTDQDGNPAETYDNFAWSLAAGDFDHDGRDDLAVGAPQESGAAQYTGAVNVYYGSPAGLRHLHSQFYTQDSPGVKDSEQAFDRFGWSVGAGDFDDDGYDDLAIGVMGEGITHHPSAGAVNVLYGSAQGLQTAGNQFWHQDSNGIKDQAEDSDLFGGTLIAADFNGDGRSDLAIGVWRESVDTLTAAGAINLLYGANAGLSQTGNQFWTQNSPGIVNDSQQYDWFSRQSPNVPN